MERLTEHHVNKTLGAYMVCSGACIKEDFDCTLCENLNKIVNTLAAYEDTGLEPEEIMGLCRMDRRAKMAELLRMEENKPLTPDDLPKMDGTPVWITKMDGGGGVWMLVDAEYELCREAHGEMAVFENCGKTWLAYRYKLEDEKK